MKNIVCISTSNYHPFPTRKQNVMNRLQDAEIIYINPPFTILAPVKDRSLFKKLFDYKKVGEKVKDNITVFSPPPLLPLFNKYRFINRINQRILAAFIRGKIKEAGSKPGLQNPGSENPGRDKPYLWCYSPTSADLVDLIPNQGVIYDCVDRHSAYPGHINPQVVDKMEADLAAKSLQVFCTAEGLYETLIKYNQNTLLIANGANYELFAKAQGNYQDPGERPVFGFVGMLQDCIEYDYMAALAQAFPKGQILLIGRSLPGVDLSPLAAYENIKFLGLMPQEKLPEVMKTFHVCLNLFKDNELSAHVSPLKFYEYLATGKPIVSTAVPAQVRDFEDVIFIAENREDFVVKCKEALKIEAPERIARRIEYAKEASWDSIVKKMEAAIEKTLNKSEVANETDK